MSRYLGLWVLLIVIVVVFAWGTYVVIAIPGQ